MPDESPRDLKSLCLLHLQFAWWSLLCFVVMGITLEMLHAFKVRWYLEQDSEIRRLMWTLAHAHGALLSLVHVAFAATYWFLPRKMLGRHRLASALLMAASILLPGGFFLGGTFVYEGDPGMGVWLVPLGALSLFLAVLLTATDISRSQPS
ncbi:MAG: hypothetical protein AB7I37_16215 [Pirellulales bacterium]